MNISAIRPYTITNSKYNVQYTSNSKQTANNHCHNSILPTSNCVSFYGLFNKNKLTDLELKVGSSAKRLEDETLLVLTNNKKRAIQEIAEKQNDINKEYKRLSFLVDTSFSDTAIIYKKDDKYILKNLSENDWLISHNKSQMRPDNYASRLTENSYLELEEGFCIKCASCSAKDAAVKFTTNIDMVKAERIAHNHLTRMTVKETEEVLKSALKEEETDETKDIDEDDDKIILPEFKKTHNDIKVNFADVGGQDKIIKELKRKVIFPIKYPKAFENVKINKGILLYGPPRCGKTLIATALANEIDANYVKVNADDLTASYVGETEKNWRELFEKAKQHQPAIIFIDEFDAISKSRGSERTQGHDDKAVSQILNLMNDNEKSDSKIFVIAATNNKKSIDSAMRDCGRFGLHLEVKLPDLNGTRKIFDIHSKNKKLSKNINKADFCKKMYEHQFNGAQIAEIATNAHFEAMERLGIFEKMEKGSYNNTDMNGFSITNEDLQKAFDKLLAQKNDIQ